MKFPATARLILFYILIQVCGLFVGFSFIESQFSVTENPEEIGNSFEIFFYILLATLVLIVLMKYNIDIIIKALILLSFISGVSIVFFSLIGIYGLILGVLLVSLNFINKNPLLAYSTTILAVSGIGAILGVSLGVIPCIVLLAILAVYDIISVFYTKHMIFMAEKEIKFPLLLMLRFRELEIGLGDFTVPLIFTVSVLNISVITSITTSIGGVFGIFLLLEFMKKTKKEFMPGLPFISVGLIVFFCISTFFLY